MERENIINELEKYRNTEDNSFDAFLTEMTNYDSFITEFFSESGEANNIKTLFSDIRKRENLNKDMSIIPSKDIANIYSEYLEGMSKFIEDIKSCEITDDKSIALYEEKFNKAKKNDALFIESLFDGKLNETKQVNLKESVNELSNMIEFKDKLSEYTEYCKNIYESLEDNEDTKSALLRNSATMLIESISNYCCHMIKNTINVYNTTKDIIDNKNAVTESSTDKFVLL